jgi:hypothetical protein
LERFGRDQHEQLIRQLFHICQTSTVALYIEQFSELIDQLSAYENKTDPMFYTLRFIDGLKDTIKSNVLLHRPSTLDTVGVLAQLQEEVMEPTRSDFRKPVYTRGPSPAQHPLPLPRPPAPAKFTSEAGNGTRSTDDKLSSLKAYRRARGLCDKCAEKWFHGHCCAPTVQLQVLEEIWELMHEPVEARDSAEPDNKSVSQELLSVSVSAVSGPSSPHTVQLQGTCQGHSISILVDSGSSLSFVNTALAAQLSGVSLMPSPMTVKVADGGHIQCSHILKAAEWTVQGYTFYTDFRVFPLSTYDVVIGMDWLEQFSPMKINWKDKWISLPYQGNLICLQGRFHHSDPSDLLHVVYLLQAKGTTTMPTDLDPRITAVLQQHLSTFEEPLCTASPWSPTYLHSAVSLYSSDKR